MTERDDSDRPAQVRRHQELRRIFELAIARPEGERKALLERECAGDDALRRRIEAMLAAADDRRFLASPTAAENGGTPKPSAATAEALSEGPGTRIGPFKLLEMIGEGGFGTVFMAEQEEPVRRRVALKIIKLGMDTRQVVARFEQERQALALMDHPNIARVIDAGATAAGRPYFVMDLVKGEPISTYCDTHKLSIDERLALFAQVCNAVQHAHTKGIIHRDLKPSNVLVTTQDGRPLAKVIDFGIAKATSSKLTDKTLFTQHEQVIGTFQYMSPEQAAGSVDIDTRSDVYSLGVMLYELLTGSTPFDTTTMRDAMLGEIQRVIREVDPPRPSTRIGSSQGAIASIAAQRRVEPKRLGTIVRGELDWIVMKSLEKERARRYDSANDLARDLERYLAGEAVVAAPPSAAYRVRKFVRKNRVGVVAAGLVSVALLVGLAGTWWGMVEARRGRDEAERQSQRADEARAEAERERAEADRQRDAAETARARTQRVADFQAHMLRRVPPFEMGRDLAADLSTRVRDAQQALDVGEEQRARSLATFNGLLAGVSMTDAARRIIDANVLARSSEAIAAEFGDEPLTQAVLHGSVGQTYEELGIYDKAKAERQRELELRTEHQGPSAREALLAKSSLGRLCWKLGELDEAARILEEVVPQIERELGQDDPSAIDGRISLAVLRMSQGRTDLARPEFERILAIQERTLGPEHEDLALTLENLGAAQLNLGENDAAVRTLERARSIRRSSRADEATALRAQRTLAQAYERQRRFDEANQIRTESIETLARIQGANHPQTIEAISALVDHYRAQERFDEALAQARRALELRRTVLGDGHPETLASMTDVGILCSTLGRHAEAERVFAEGLERATQTFGADSPKTMDRVNNLAVAYWYRGKFAEVEPLFARVLEFNRRVFGESSTETADAMLNMAILLEKLGRAKESLALLEQALEINRTRLGEEHENTLRVKSSLASAYFEAGDLKEAEALLRAVIESMGRVLGESHPTTLEAKMNLGVLLHQSGRNDEAEPVLLDVLERRRKTIDADNPETLLALGTLVDTYVDSGRLEQARPLIEDLVAARKRAAQASDASPKALDECAQALVASPVEELRDPKLALEYARRACALTGNADAQYVRTLARALHASGDHAGAVEAIRKALAILPADATDRATFDANLREFEAARDGR